MLRGALEAEPEDAEPTARPGLLGRLFSNRDVAILIVAVVLLWCLPWPARVS